MSKILMALHSLWFIIVMVVGGVAFWLMPKQTVSNDENRELKALPVADEQTVLSGKFSKEFEEYYNDHFPLRDEWIAFANDIKALKGVQNDEFRVITAPPPAPKPSKDESKTPPTSDNSAIAHAQATPNQNPQEVSAEEVDIDQEEFSKVRGVVVVNGRVVQNFGGSKATISPYATMLGKYRQKLDPSVKMYVMMIPAGSDFYMPKQVHKGVLKEKENIALLNSLLDPTIIPVPAYEEMLPHKDEYIMYRTDHHWTGLGAYYAYRAMAKTAGFVPVELSQMTHAKHEKTFMGSLYKYTRDEGLKKNPDIVEYQKIPTADTTKVYVNTAKSGHTDATTPWVLYYEKTNNYGLFLGGDYPLVKITTQNQSGRKILLIKDSFGNALAPFLASHFDEVFVIDYRHFKGGVLSLIKEHGITDFLYAHNSFAANSDAVVKLGTAMMK